jgi:uncharacterized protein (TIGR00730 family)
MPDTPKSPPKSNRAQREAPSFRLAALDRDFLLGDSTRGVRFQLEYAKAEEGLRAWGVRSTIVVFGSARLREDGPPRHAAWHRAARDFGRIVSEQGGALRPDGTMRDNVIATGGGPGLMEAANRGASDAGAPSIGFNIGLPHEQEPNPYSTPELTFRFHYFAMRKMHLAMRANALVVFPGGFGTLDELFEMLTLKQTERSPPLPILLYDEAYWRSVVNFEAMVDAGVITHGELKLFEFANDSAKAWEKIARHNLDFPRPFNSPEQIGPPPTL